MSKQSSSTNPNLKPWIDPDLEARIVALVLGEASDFESEQLDRIIGERRELQIFRRYIERAHDQLTAIGSGKFEEEHGETENDDDDEAWRLSDERRATVLETLGKPSPKPSPKEIVAVAASAAAREKKSRRWRRDLILGAVAGIAASIFLFFSFVSQPDEMASGTAPQIVASSMPSSADDDLERSEIMKPSVSRQPIDPNSLALQYAPMFNSRSTVAKTPPAASAPPPAGEPAGSAGSGPMPVEPESRGGSALLALGGTISEAQQLLGEDTRSGGAGDSDYAEGLVPRFGATSGRQQSQPQAGRNFTSGGTIVGTSPDVSFRAPTGGNAQLDALGFGVAGAEFGNGGGGGAAAPKSEESDGSQVKYFFGGTSAVNKPGKSNERGISAAPKGNSGQALMSDLPAAATKAGKRLSDLAAGGGKSAADPFARTNDESGAEAKMELEELSKNQIVARDASEVSKPTTQKVAPAAAERPVLRLDMFSDVAMPRGDVNGNGPSPEPGLADEELGQGLGRSLDSKLSLFGRPERESAPAESDARPEQLAAAVQAPRSAAVELLEQDGNEAHEAARRQLLFFSAKRKAGKEIDEVNPLDLSDQYFAKRPAVATEVTRRKLAEVRFPEILAATEPFSTFSLHVSDVSFKLAQASLANGEWPEPAKIRIEEFVNAFDYGDPMPGSAEKIACQQEQTIHPFLQQRNLLRVSMRTAEAGRSSQTPLRLTLLLDNSGSMERVDRRGSVLRAFLLLTQQLLPQDQVTLIGFARQPRLLADRVNGQQARQLAHLVANTPSEGGTNLEAALNLAFAKAMEQKTEGAQNRIVLLTDGAANLGDAAPERLSGFVERMRSSGIAFDAAGVGADGLNDEILEALTRKGDGRYYFLNQPSDADDGFAKQIAGALRPAAMNVKVQVEFNSDRVGRYKLLGYEKHRLNKEDFRDDSVDAAEMAAAEAGVAVYQFEPLPNGSGDIGSVSVRFRDMSTNRMVEKRWPIPYQPAAPRIENAEPPVAIASVAALFAAKLKGDPAGESADLSELSRILSGLPERYRNDSRIQQLLAMIEQAKKIQQ